MICPKTAVEAPELGTALQSRKASKDVLRAGDSEPPPPCPRPSLSPRGCGRLLVRDTPQAQACSVGPGCIAWANALIRARSGFSAVTLLGDLGKISWGIAQPSGRGQQSKPRSWGEKVLRKSLIKIFTKRNAWLSYPQQTLSDPQKQFPTPLSLE